MGHAGSGRPAGAVPDADNNLGRGAPDDRDERLRQKRRNESRSIEKPDSASSKSSKRGERA